MFGAKVTLLWAFLFPADWLLYLEVTASPSLLNLLAHYLLGKL
uniref:Uncharacterized protein n=1 Tax=Anguilla anguilla TaxID=7936 RepID=A0A0E9TCY2_ANGAN